MLANNYVGRFLRALKKKLPPFRLPQDLVLEIPVHELFTDFKLEDVTEELVSWSFNNTLFKIRETYRDSGLLESVFPDVEEDEIEDLKLISHQYLGRVPWQSDTLVTLDKLECSFIARGEKSGIRRKGTVYSFLILYNGWVVETGNDTRHRPVVRCLYIFKWDIFYDLLSSYSALLVRERGGPILETILRSKGGK